VYFCYNESLEDAPLGVATELIYYQISKEKSSLYFGLDVFCIFEARVLEFCMINNFTAAPVFQWKRIRVQIITF
jgi:hypothetical protein